VRFPPGTKQYPAILAEGVLTLRSPGDTVRQWVKRSSTLDSSFLALSHGVTLLSPVVVEAPRADERLRDVGFIQRMQSLSGTFITREDIVRQNPETTADLLRRVPGFRVGSGGVVSAPRETQTLCAGVAYYIDGVHADGSELSFVLPNAVAGIEVYTSAATVPIQYQFVGHPRCGVILIWTVEGGRIQ
jgi:outer membrane receptor protein involved in Fe transport